MEKMRRPVKKLLPRHATVYLRASTCFSQLCRTVVNSCEKKGTMGSKLTTSPIYDRLTVFLRNRTKGPEIQIQDKDLRFKKIFQPLTTDIFDL